MASIIPASLGLMIDIPNVPSDLLTGLLGAWNFDNDALDEVASNDGTLVNTPTYATGKIGQAIDLDGINQYVSFADNGWNITGDFSISCWFKMGSSHSGALISNLTTSGQTRGWLLQTAGQDVRFNSWAAGAQQTNLQTSNTPLTPGVWYNLIVVRVGSTGFTVYLDGVSILSDTNAVDPGYLTTNYNTVGVQRNGVSDFLLHFDGLIDTPNIWTKELSTAEIAELYNSGVGKQYPF